MAEETRNATPDKGTPIIPSDKPVQPWVAPEVEQVIRIPHEKLHAFKDHPFNVEKNSKFTAFVASIRAQGVTQPVIVRPDDTLS